MSVKQASMLTKQVIRDGLSYILRGGLRIKNGHLPIEQHVIPNNFIGVCVASNANPATDDYVVQQLQALGIKRVRLDLTYGDLTRDNSRFLRRLIAEKLAITLHLLQPFDAAKNMHLKTEQAIWRQFLSEVLELFGSQIQAIEIGNTINRKRWAGYTLDGFLQAWAIAHTEIKVHGVTLIGPNIQDFEPLYNISLLKTFKNLNQLPDIHSNNLFSERTTEPERFDHRIFKYQWARVFKYNLIKKARILQKIGHDFGVNDMASSVAFWAIYRIQRLLPDGLQKQADYAARYFLLLAASDSLTHANWGALICQREGLITDGLTEADYPDLERVTYYKNADGALENYQHHPSFNAVKTVTNLIQGARYIVPIATANGLEIHHFSQGNLHFHAAWTINGKAALLSDIYSADALQTAKILHRDGEALTQHPDLITESPIYLIWNDSAPAITNAQLAKDVAIHAHVPDLQYFAFRDGDWQGLVLAKNMDDAQLIMHNLHPISLMAPNKDGALRHARNAIWAVPDPRNVSAAHGVAKELTIKQPVKMYPHKAFLDRFKPSKAKRSWNGAMELMRRGIATAQPVAYFEKAGDTTLKQNFYLCEFVQADANIGQIFAAYTRGEFDFLGLKPESVYTQLAIYCHTMHSRGIHFRDLSGGNILVNIGVNKQLSFSLIDTARIHSYNHGISTNLRIADLTRACHKLHWAGRIRFMQIYLGLSGMQFTWQHRMQFQLYDFKVSLKRTIGRKGIKRLVKRLKGNT
ncbi:MAG: lipopolysaccharide kinase InaA family protein [Pseudomonadota bacterium]